MNRYRQFTSWDEVPVIMPLNIAAIALDCSVETLKTKSRNGVFPAFKDGMVWKVSKNDLMAYIEKNKVRRTSTQSKIITGNYKFLFRVKK